MTSVKQVLLLFIMLLLNFAMIRTDTVFETYVLEISFTTLCKNGREELLQMISTMQDEDPYL